MTIVELEARFLGQLAAKEIVVGTPCSLAAVEEVWRDMILKTEPVVLVEYSQPVAGQISISWTVTEPRDVYEAFTLLMREFEGRLWSPPTALAFEARREDLWRRLLAARRVA